MGTTSGVIKWYELFQYLLIMFGTIDRDGRAPWEYFGSHFNLCIKAHTNFNRASLKVMMFYSNLMKMHIGGAIETVDKRV